VDGFVFVDDGAEAAAGAAVVLGVLGESVFAGELVGSDLLGLFFALMDSALRESVR
jgi:hypothetical protein